MSASWENLWRKVQLKYPGGDYHVPKTEFEQLEEEGIIVPEEARHFPYHEMSILNDTLIKKKHKNWKTQTSWIDSHLMCLWVWASVATCLVTKHRNVSCLTVTQACSLQNLCSTWSPSAREAILCCAISLHPSLKRLNKNLFLVVGHRRWSTRANSGRHPTGKSASWKWGKWK